MKGKYKLSRFGRFVIFASFLSASLYFAYPSIDKHLLQGESIRVKLLGTEFVIGSQETTKQDKIEKLNNEIEKLTNEIAAKRLELSDIK